MRQLLFPATLLSFYWGVFSAFAFWFVPVHVIFEPILTWLVQLYLHNMFRKIEVVYLCVKHHTVLISVWNIYLFCATYVILSIKYVVLRSLIILVMRAMQTLFVSLKPVSYLLYSYIFCSITIQMLPFVEDKFRCLVHVRLIVLTCKVFTIDVKSSVVLFKTIRLLEWCFLLV